MTDEFPDSTPTIPVQPAVGEVSQQWRVVTSDGPLVIAQSSYEYAVYDQQHSYGRWPLTEDGYRYAVETYEAHRQSLVHGIAYAATGYQDPTRLGLPTEPVIKSKTYASPLSYVGSTRRIIAWASNMGKRNPLLAAVGWLLAIFALGFMWTFVTFWYVIVFGLFGIFMFPYRLIRRSQRKSLHVQQTTLATQQAMLQQMTMMQQPGYGSPAQQFSPSSPPAIATHQQTNDGSTALASAPTPGSPYGATPNPATPGGASAAPTPTPAGWYGDPSGRHQYRYWNGTSWTEQVMSNNTQSVDPLPPA